MAQVLRRRGRIQVRLDAQERQVLLDVIARLQAKLPRVRDTLSRTYDDPKFQDEYLRWVRPESDAGAEADVTVVRDSLESGENTLPLTEAQALCWLRALNHLRLAAGSVLGVSDDGWMERADTKTQRSFEYGVLIGLGYIQEELVAALDS
jgi:hypothetical protein